MAGILIYLNAYAPVIFCLFWSFQMVIKEQDSDPKLANIILEITKDEDNRPKDIIVLKKKLALNMVHEFALRCMFFLYAAYTISLLKESYFYKMKIHREYSTNVFYFETIFVTV